MTQILLVLVSTLHLLSVNVAAAGPLVCVWFEWREGRGDRPAGQVGRWLASMAIVLLVVGSLLGVVVGVLVWSPEYLQAIKLLGPKIHLAGMEFIFSLVMMIGHLVWWKFAPQCAVWLRALRALLPVLAGTNLMYHFPFLFAVLSKVVAGTIVLDEKIDPAQFRTLIVDGEVFSQTVHFWLASFAVTGVMLIGHALRSIRRSADEADAARVAVWGGRLAVVPTLLQILVGLWVVVELPPGAQSQVMGGDGVATSLFVASVLLALYLMHQLAAIALGDTKRKRLVQAMALMTLVVLLMNGTAKRISTEPPQQTGLSHAESYDR